jgi:purine-cytosine permease-like protein
VLAVLLGVVATVLALVLHIADYQSFLLLIGSVFVPLSAVLVVDYFVLGHGRNWDTSEGARPRWSRLLPWVIGFAAYQLVYPGGVSWWVTGWTHLQRWLHFTPASVYSSASLVSFAAAGLLTLLVGWRGRARA